MPWTSLHLKWLVNTGQKLTTPNGQYIEVWEFRYENDETVFSAWGRHFRNHYCLDSEIDFFRKGYKYSRAQYLYTIKFPDCAIRPGPSIRAGDFGEILAADYLEFVLGFWVPRTRYADKTVRNESTKGCDIIGFKVMDNEGDSLDDTLAIFESKTQFSSSPSMSRMQDAVDDSQKDQFRKGESLNAVKQRLAHQGHREDACRIERFQNPEDRPYKEVSGAVALFSTSYFDPELVSQVDCKDHPNSSNLVLLVIHGHDMMKLVNELYARAADEA